MWSGRLALAALDDTVVSLPHADGMLSEVTLQRAELFSHVTGDALTGRFASADKPVALVTYAPQAYIPWDFPRELGIDSHPVITMGLPTNVWGSESQWVAPKASLDPVQAPWYPTEPSFT